MATVTVDPVPGEYPLWCATATDGERRAVVVSDDREKAAKMARESLDTRGDQV